MVGLLMAKKSQIASNPYPRLGTLTPIPHPPKNITKKSNPTHPIFLLTLNQFVNGWKPIENPWVQLVVSHQEVGNLHVASVTYNNRELHTVTDLVDKLSGLEKNNK
jgi:hypothetical protein